MGFFASLVIVPISSIVYVGIAAGFFYYIFLFLFKTSVLYRDLYILNIFAAIPTYLSFTISQQLPPISPRWCRPQPLFASSRLLRNF